MQITFHSALIMGSSRGISGAIAIKLAQEGAKKIGIRCPVMDHRQSR